MMNYRTARCDRGVELADSRFYEFFCDVIVISRALKFTLARINAPATHYRCIARASMFDGILFSFYLDLEACRVQDVEERPL